jgi:lantibiotic biosynthesis protein
LLAKAIIMTINSNILPNAATYVQKLHSIIQQCTANNNSLLGGNLGLALYYYTRYKIYNNTTDATAAVRIVTRIIDDLNNSSTPIIDYNFSTGAAGLCYILNIFSAEGIIDVDMDADFAHLEKFIFTAAMYDVHNNNKHDYLHGVMGAVHYFLTRLPNPTIQRYIQEITAVFCNKAIISTQGIWFKNNVIPTDKDAEINTSLAHGQVSFLLLLMQVAHANINTTQINALVAQGLQFLDSYKRAVNFEKEMYAMYPSTINSTNDTEQFFTTRLAWCYGDLNLAHLFYTAEKTIGGVWSEEARRQFNDVIGINTTLRKTAESTAAIDTHFCQGTAGIAQYYKYLYELTQIQAYKTAWHYWIEQTLLLLPSELDKGIYTGRETDMLEGLVGVNLVLLSYIHDAPLQWSKALLI